MVSDWRTVTAEWRLGDCLSIRGERAEAEQMLLAGVDKARESQQASPGSLATALKCLLAHDERGSARDKAAAVRDEIARLEPPKK